MTRDQVRLLLDAMIPGQANRWPAASDVVDLQRMADALTPMLAQHASAMPGDGTGMDAWLARLADADPSALRAVTESVYAAYYTSPAVQAVIRDLAESGPRDETSGFDESLLNAVRARAAQPRRP